MRADFVWTMPENGVCFDGGLCPCRRVGAFDWLRNVYGGLVLVFFLEGSFEKVFRE